MGGSNSGTWCRWNKKTTVEECRRIDIRYLKKIGQLHPGCSRMINYSRGDEVTGSIRYRVFEGYLKLDFRIRKHGGDWQDIEQNIRITETSCHFGGTRKWFVCPNCNRRITTLCQGHKYYLCRHCYGLTYSSCSEHWIERIMRKQRKIKTKLGAEPNSDWIPEKPKGMHWKTYEKRYNEFIKLDDCSENALHQMMQRL